MELTIPTTRRLLLAAVAGVTICSIAAPILLSEQSLHIRWKSPPDPAEADGAARPTGATWDAVRTTSPDGVQLSAWLFTPGRSNGAAVILLHGVGADRTQMLPHASYLLRAGYTVLTPDSRNHGASGGDTVTYGLREAVDVHAWADMLLARIHGARLYGLGESMGAAVLLQSLAREPRFRAVVAEAPFDTFEHVATYRMGQLTGLGQRVVWPWVRVGFFYIHLAHGLDMETASPARAIRFTKVPILLIHGDADTNIPPSESIALHAANPSSTELWLVTGAQHTRAFAAAPDEYVRHVLAWFQSHALPAGQSSNN